MINKISPNASPLNKPVSVPILARFAWCALVALRLAQQEGRALSELQQHLFLMQWLATAQKQKRFPKAIASDLIWLLDQGKKFGFAAKLNQKLEYLYRSTSGVLVQQSDLFRLTYCIDTLKTMGWSHKLVTQKALDQGLTERTSANTLYVAKASLENSYSDAGELLAPISLHFAGDTRGVPAFLTQCYLHFQREPDVHGLAVFTLLQATTPQTEDVNPS